MVKRFVSVALSVSLVLSMTPFGMKRALADELPQDNPVEYEVPAEEEEVPEDNFFEAPEEVPEEIPAEEQEVPDEEIPAEEDPEEEQKEEQEEEEPEEVPAETPSEDKKEVPAEEVPAEKVEEKTEELLDDSEKKEENLEEDAFDEDEVDGAEAVKALPAVTGLSWAPSRDNGHMKVTWSLDTEDIDEPGDAKVNAVINVYKDGAQIGSVTKGYSTKSVDLTDEGLVPLDSSSSYYVTVQIKPDESEKRFTEGETVTSDAIVPSEYTTRSLNVSFVPIVAGDNDISFNFEWSGLYGDARTMYVAFSVNGVEVRNGWLWNGINTLKGKRENYYHIGTRNNQMNGVVIQAGDTIEATIWMGNGKDSTRYCETYLKTTVYKAVPIKATFDTQGIGSLTNNVVDLNTGESIGTFDEVPAADGYIFRGWSKAKKAEGEYDFDADAFNLSEKLYEDTTLYAMWERVYLKVTFDPNGGEGSKEMLVAKGNSINLPENMFTAPVGKTFDKWEAGVPGDTLTPSGDVTIKALWKDIPAEYNAAVKTITWKRGSGVAAGGTINRNYSNEKTYGLFESIEYKGAVVDKSNYTTSEGSLNFSFKPEYLETLSDGEHTFKINFADGSCDVVVKIVTVKKVDANPKTGDTSAADMMLVLMLLGAAGTSIIAIMKKQKNAK